MNTNSLAHAFFRLATLALAGAAAAARAETLTSPDSTSSPGSLTPLAVAREPLSPQHVIAMATTNARTAAKAKAIAPRPFRATIAMEPMGPIVVGGTSGLGVLEGVGFRDRAALLNAEMAARQAAVKAVDPTAKFIWQR